MTSRFGRENAVNKAKLQEEGKLYDEMVQTMKNLANTVAELTAEERNLLNRAYKKKSFSLRAEWRRLSEDLEKESDEANADLIRECRNKVEEAMTDMCRDAELIVDNRLLPSCKIDDYASSVFYLKMKGDLIRHLVEFKTGDEKKIASDKSKTVYEVAMDIARMALPPTDPLRLGVALNFSVFIHDVLGLLDSACEMANQAYSEAAADLDLYSIIGDAYQEGRRLMNILKENVTIWEDEKLE